MSQYDLIIIGGGMVGATLAAVLKNTDLHIALVDAAPKQAVEDERLIALNDASVCLFENCGIWPMLSEHATNIKQVHVSKRGRFGVTRIDAKVVGLSALGYVVPATYINAALETHLRTANNLTWIKPGTLESLSEDNEGVKLVVRTPKNLEYYNAKLVIGADGSYSTVRALLNIPTEIIDYQQSALVTTTLLSREHHNMAYERFLDDGALAMLPLKDRKVATIWTAGNAMIARLMALSDQDFTLELQKHFGYRLGRLQSIAKRAIYPLKMIKAKYQHQGHVWLIGNAAHTIHPIAAQGLNLALYEVAMITSSLLEKDPALMDKIDQQHFIQQLSHRLTWLFSTDMFGFNQVRQMGLVGLDLMTSLKKHFTEKAIGKGGFVPALLTRKNE